MPLPTHFVSLPQSVRTRELCKLCRGHIRQASSPPAATRSRSRYALLLEMPSSRAIWFGFRPSRSSAATRSQVLLVDLVPSPTARCLRRRNRGAPRSVRSLGQQAARLLDVQLEAGALARQVVGRPADGDHQVEHVLAARGAALLTLLVGVMDDRARPILMPRKVSRKRCSFSQGSGSLVRKPARLARLSMTSRSGRGWRMPEQRHLAVRRGEVGQAAVGSRSASRNSSAVGGRAERRPGASGCQRPPSRRRDRPRDSRPAARHPGSLRRMRPPRRCRARRRSCPARAGRRAGRASGLLIEGIEQQVARSGCLSARSSLGAARRRVGLDGQGR